MTERVSHKDGFDFLGESVLKHGDHILVSWPDGTIHNHVVVAKRTAEMVAYGHERPHEDYIVSTFVEITFHGVKGLVPLLGLEAQRL